jgi:hypothetical protein
MPADEVLAAISELKALITRSADSASPHAPAYLPVGKLAAHFGLSRSYTHRIATAAAAAGKVEVLHPTVSGAKGYALYSVADFKKYLTANH